MGNGMRLPLSPAFGKALAPIVTECVTANSYYAPNTGRGIRAGIWAGAKMDSSCAPMVFDRGVVAPGVKAGYVEDANGNLVFPGTMSQLIIGTQPYLKVNKEGKRFANESVPYDFMNYAASLQTDGVYAAILPGNVTDDILAYDQYGCAQIAVNIAQGNGIIPMLEGMIEDGLVFKADTIEELAEKMGLPADTLAATVARYNELAQKGVDEDYGKEAYRLRPITQAPFYGYFMGGSLLCTCDGLRINDKCQVYDTNHKTIGGLYAIGNCSGSFFSGNYPRHIPGTSIGRAVTFGYVAAESAVNGTLGKGAKIDGNIPELAVYGEGDPVTDDQRKSFESMGVWDPYNPIHGSSLDYTPEQIESFIDDTFSSYIRLMAQNQQKQCPSLFYQRLVGEGALETLPKERVAFLSGMMAITMCAILDKLGQYEFGVE